LNFGGHYLCRIMETISPASVEDVPQLMQLVNNAYRGEQAKKGWTHEADLIDGTLRTDEATLKNLLQDPAAVVLVYREAGRLAGCVYLQKQDQVLYLGMLSVSPEIQAQGIGKKLLKAAEEHARKNSCIRIEMTVISVRDELIAWYERHGYYKTGRTKPFHEEKKFGVPRQPIFLLVMEKNF
jgi:ribosomal protein S18 acetylase RimI-like enzyme